MTSNNHPSGPLQEIPAAELQRMEKECESLYDNWFSDSDKITAKYWYMQAATAEYIHFHQPANQIEEVPDEEMKRMISEADKWAKSTPHPPHLHEIEKASYLGGLRAQYLRSRTASEGSAGMV